MCRHQFPRIECLMCLFICVLHMMSFIPNHFGSRDSHALPRHVKILSLPPTRICSWHISGFASQRCISFKTSRMSFRCIQHRSLRPVRHHICILHSRCFVAFSSSTLRHSLSYSILPVMKLWLLILMWLLLSHNSAGIEYHHRISKLLLATYDALATSYQLSSELN